jgi:hypothetical protein
MKTPVALIAFNRPDKAKKVMRAIASAKPEKLFLIFDGPRSDHPEDHKNCAATQAIVDMVDWKCEVQKKISDTNLGCGRGPAEGTNWVFEHVDRAIILEDDCIPDISFFRFCDTLLEKYKDDDRIVQVSGNNYQLGRIPTHFSYYFSYFNICLGAFATWKRAWRHFDYKNLLWKELRETAFILDYVIDERAVPIWHKAFDKAYNDNENISYWDHQWTFACWAQNGLSILPQTPLVTNIGHDSDATHTTSSNSIFANTTIVPVEFPLDHPPCVVRNREADLFFIENAVLPSFSLGKPKRRPFIKRALNAVKRKLG